MAEELEQLWENLNLTEREETILDLGDVQDVERDRSLELSVIGRVLTSKPFFLSAMKNALIGAWRLPNDFAINEIEHNCFRIQFMSRNDKTKVLEEGPWHFDKNLIVFGDGAGGLQTHRMIPKEVCFWVRLCNLPLNRRDNESVTRIGARIGRVVKVDVGDRFSWSKFAKVRVGIDVDKPLARGVMVKDGNGEKIWVSFKYERLMNYCYVCGLLNHLEGDCPARVDSKTPQVWQYDPILRATPGKHRLFNKPSSSQQQQSSNSASSGNNLDGSSSIPARRQLNLELLESDGSPSGLGIEGRRNIKKTAEVAKVREGIKDLVLNNESSQPREVNTKSSFEICRDTNGGCKQSSNRKTSIGVSQRSDPGLKDNDGRAKMAMVDVEKSMTIQSKPSDFLVHMGGSIGCFHQGISDGQKGEGSLVLQGARSKAGAKGKRSTYVRKGRKSKNVTAIPIDFTEIEAASAGKEASSLILNRSFDERDRSEKELTDEVRCKKGKTDMMLVESSDYSTPAAAAEQPRPQQ